MDNAQHEWARAELEKVYPSIDNRVRQAVTALLSVWTRVDLPLDRVQQAEAVDVFAKLATLRPLEGPKRDDGPKRVWAPASQYAGSAKYARVKLDSIPEDEQWKFADRVAEIVGIRRGYVTTVFLDVRDGAPAGHQGPIKDFEVDISHLRGGNA
jgi:hypothetical protein